MDKVSRNPLTNDLTMQPTDTGVLHESSQFSSPWTGKSGIPFSFDWMLSIPSLSTSFVTQDVTTPTILNTMTLPNLNAFSSNVDYTNIAWNCIPFAWASWCRRKTQVTYMAVKCLTPIRLQLDYTPTHKAADNQVFDYLRRRNYTKDLDFSEQRVHTFTVNPVFPMAYKVSSTMVVPYNGTTGNLLLFNPRDQSFLDGTLTMTQTLPGQRGMIFPDQFNVFIWVSYTGTVRSCIASPSACASTFDFHLLPRIVPGTQYATSYVDYLDFPVT